MLLELTLHHSSLPLLTSRRMSISLSHVVQREGRFSLFGGQLARCGKLNFPFHTDNAKSGSVAEIAELAREPQGGCGQRQLEDARLALADITGGGIHGFDRGACAVHVLGYSS
jgi:hypothetical protein